MNQTKLTLVIMTIIIFASRDNIFNTISWSFAFLGVVNCQRWYKEMKNCVVKRRYGLRTLLFYTNSCFKINQLWISKISTFSQRKALQRSFINTNKFFPNRRFVQVLIEFNTNRDKSNPKSYESNHLFANFCQSFDIVYQTPGTDNLEQR